MVSFVYWQATSLNRSINTSGRPGVSSFIQSASETDFVSIALNLIIFDSDFRCVKHLVDSETIKTCGIKPGVFHK